MTLVELKAEYAHARRRAERAATHTAEACPPNTCRYCGKPWQRWNGSMLDGHAACIVDDRFKHHAKRVLSDPKITYRDVGLALEISPSVVRSWTFPIKATPFYKRA